ncbi:MAG: tol-pal system protein YbgF [Mariprofundaceae bacterium]
MDYRLLAMEKIVKKQQTDIDALNASVKSLRQNSLKKNTDRISSKKSRKAEQKLVKKLNKIESSIKLAAQTAAQNKTGKPAINPNDEKNSYTAAYLSLKSGRYDESVIAFKSLLHKYPEGEYTDQALYWLGESYFTQHENADAIKTFKRLAKDFPASAKHPAALLKLATTYKEEDRLGDAKAVLQRLIQQHPDSNAAEQARRRIELLTKRMKK